MKAMVLAAGLGNRLRPLTDAIPKPMVPVVNKPILEHILETIKAAGIKEVFANLHHQPNVIRDYFKDGSDFDLSVRYSYEPEPMGTAGGLKILENDFKKGTFTVFSGDLLTDIDLNKMYKFHRLKGSLATMALTRVADPSKYGAVLVDTEGKIIDFQEKPYHEEAISNVINAGIYIFEPEILKQIPDGSFFDFGKDLFPELIKQKAPVYGFLEDYYWMDVGGINAYHKGNFDALKKKIDLRIEGRETSDGVITGLNSEIGENLNLIAPVLIGRNCVIGDDVTLRGPMIIGDGSRIGDRSSLRSSIIWNNCRIGEGSVVVNAILTSLTSVG